ncbi:MULTISPECIES: O-antigen ligase family protein [Paenibacillus]|uniref:O-antigen ligase family protein n=1 Tax=Paenibacillus TaxID=44249 RepID=UPI0013E362C8|nr:O-antigen ligase family protein [Paenibacillus glycanilyticus]
MENVVKLLDTTRNILLKGISIIAVLLMVLIIGYLAAVHDYYAGLWQLSIVMALTLIGWFIQQVKPVLYLPYLLAVWAIYPELRRLLDWSFGAYSETPILSTAPLFVSLVMLIPIVKNFRKLSKTVLRIETIALSVLLYGFLIGIIQYGGIAASFDLINYATPLLIIAYVNVSPFQSQTRDWLLKGFAYIAVLVALYGIYQYFLIPPWDKFWMIHSEMLSIGKPEPLKVRVFSTLNSPGPAGVFFGFALAVMTMNKKWRALGLIGMVIVAFGFLLTLVRSSWIALAAMILVYFLQAKSTHKFKLLTILVVLFLCYQFILPGLPGAETITNRFDTFGNLNEDVSYNDRLAFSTFILDSISVNPMGNGLGSTGLSAKLNENAMQVFDNGFLNIFYTFGLPGGLAFLGFLIYLSILALKREKQSSQYYHLAFASMAGAAVLLMSNNFLPGSGGACLWFLVSMIFLRGEKEKYENLLRHP